MTHANVFLWGTNIGMLSLPDDSRFAAFEYSSDFLASSIEIAPFTMPLSNKVFSFPALSLDTFKGLPGIFSDSLPDRFGNKVINAWLSRQGREADSLNPLERLCYTGKRGMGALEYEPALGFNSTRLEKIDINELVELSRVVLADRESFSINVEKDRQELLKLVQVGTSAGGARAKALVAWNKKTNEMKSGQIDAGDGFDYYLVKFDGVSGNGDHGVADSTGFCNIEYSYYLMARECGINISDSELYRENGRSHFITKRFDRNPDGKLHMLTLGGMKHFDFNNPGVNSYEQCSMAIMDLGLGSESVEELYRRMCLNIVARNNDDHVKNISFLMDRRGKWRLSPAYDITFSYRPDSTWVNKHQMTMNGKREGFLLEDFIDSALNMNIKKRKALEILEQVESTAKCYKSFAEKANIQERNANVIQRQFEYFLP